MHQWNLHLCQAWTPTEESENLKKQICQETFPAKRSLQETNPHFFSWADFVPLKQGQNKQYQYESDFHISFWLKWFEMIKTLSELHKMKPAKLEWNYHYHYSIAIIIIIPDLSCTFFQPSFLHQLPLAAQIPLNSLTFELLNVSFSLALLATDRQRVTCGIHLTTIILGYPLVHL